LDGGAAADDQRAAWLHDHVASDGLALDVAVAPAGTITLPVTVGAPPAKVPVQVVVAAKAGVVDISTPPPAAIIAVTMSVRIPRFNLFSSCSPSSSNAIRGGASAPDPTLHLWPVPIVDISGISPEKVVARGRLPSFNAH
jgi:hypothetical protein